jgi:flagellar biosynthesis GTPase FlhF
MFRKFGMAALILTASAIPAFAASSQCSNPIAPAAVDGSLASEAQMKGAHDDVVNFIKSSDDYQQCLVNDLDAQKEAAAKAKDPKPLDPSIEDAVNEKIAANQRLKEKVGGEYNAAVQAFKSKHPG